MKNEERYKMKEYELLKTIEGMKRVQDSKDRTHPFLITIRHIQAVENQVEDL